MNGNETRPRAKVNHGAGAGPRGVHKDLQTSEDKQCELRECDVFYTAGNFHQDLKRGMLCSLMFFPKAFSLTVQRRTRTRARKAQTGVPDEDVVAVAEKIQDLRQVRKFD